MSSDDELGAAELRVAEVIGGLMQFWGFKAILGRLWAVLYLSPDPLPAAQLAARLQASTGAVSMALGELQKWGAVKKSWRPGERRDFYEAETSVWKMVARVFRERELGYVHAAAEVFAAVRKELGRQRAGADPATRRRLKHVDGRLAALLTLTRIGEGLITMLTRGRPVDPQPMVTLFDPEDSS